MTYIIALPSRNGRDTVGVERYMQPSQRKLDGLTGLRAVAAIWVIAFHYSQGTFATLGTAHASKLVEYGYLAVDLFFILSGFVIWHVHAAEFTRFHPRRFARFMALRFARLYPVHLVTLGLLAFILWCAPQWGDPPLNPANYTGRQFLLYLALVQSWGFTKHLAWNYPSWSVSAEWFCYLLFPILALAATRFGRSGTVAAIVLLLMGVAATYFTVFERSLNQATGVLPLLRAAPEFLLGCLLQRLAQRTRLEAVPWAMVVVGLALLWAVSYWTVLPVGLTALPLFAALILACSTEGNAVSRTLSVRPLVAAGAASYSLYLMQAPVQKGARVLNAYLATSHPLQDAAVVLAYVCLLGFGTALVHLSVEDPSRRWLRRVIDRWLPRQPVAAPALSASGSSRAGVVR